jgi:hypothetical protein
VCVCVCLVERGAAVVKELGWSTREGSFGYNEHMGGILHGIDYWFFVFCAGFTGYSIALAALHDLGILRWNSKFRHRKSGRTNRFWLLAQTVQNFSGKSLSSVLSCSEFCSWTRSIGVVSAMVVILGIVTS